MIGGILNCAIARDVDRLSRSFKLSFFENTCGPLFRSRRSGKGRHCRWSWV